MGKLDLVLQLARRAVILEGPLYISNLAVVIVSIISIPTIMLIVEVVAPTLSISSRYADIYGTLQVGLVERLCDFVIHLDLAVEAIPSQGQKQVAF